MKMITEEFVQRERNGEVVTTSRVIAEKFGKRHDTVLRKIESMSDEVFTHLKIAVSEYVDQSGKANKMYRLNRDAFSFIAMGFTGKEADRWKLAFIDAFNQMENHLRNMLSREWAEHRDRAALQHQMMSNTLQEVRKLHGKSTEHYHYANESKLVNWALTGKFQKVERSLMSEQDLALLASLETYNAVLLGAGHDRDTRKALLKNRCAEAQQEVLEVLAR